MAEAAARLDTDSASYHELLRWLRGPGRDVNERFEASLFLYERNVLTHPAPYVTANVNLWPQMDVLLANPGRLAAHPYSPPRTPASRRMPSAIAGSPSPA